MNGAAQSQSAAARRARALDAAFFFALLATALAMGAALAHLLELANKIGLSQEDYFTVQQVYRGWALLGFVLFVQLSAIIATIVMSRSTPRVMRPAAMALACLAGAQVLFWVFTFPANTATDNWTVPPANWEALRASWEYSHAAGALLQTGAMAFLIGAVLRRRGG